jgi:hypothetical protein
MWRHKTSVAEERPIEIDSAWGELDALDLRVLRILDEAGADQSLRHARRATDDLAVLLIGSGVSTFFEFDQSLARLEAHNLIRLDKDDFANLSEQGRDRISPRGLTVQQADRGNRRVPAVA